ncbi:hypothetical protein ABZY14_31255 [Streptomyces sp. NPDC006617]|uniref:hypothetical protein n=1 Tax=Streptomyces sp. NPDC006617 TaxID=3155354 RepID=UPI0033B6D1F4
MSESARSTAWIGPSDALTATITTGKTRRMPNTAMRMPNATRDIPATPREAFDPLTTGNLRFAAGTPGHPDQDAARRAGAMAEQHSYAVGAEVLGSIEYGVSGLGSAPAVASTRTVR